MFVVLFCRILIWKLLNLNTISITFLQSIKSKKRFCTSNKCMKDGHVCFFHTLLGDFQLLGGHNFALFCPPTHLNLDIFEPKDGQKLAFRDYLAVSSLLVYVAIESPLGGGAAVAKSILRLH